MTPSILLIPSDDGPSMRRYARELFGALGALPNLPATIALEPAPPPPRAPRILSGPGARRLEQAWGRYVAYPRSLRGRKADVFHVLDHGYAHLTRSLDPERTIVTCHDVIPLLAAAGAIPIRVSPMLARSFRWRMAQMARARAVIAISASTKEMLQRHTSISPDRIVVVPYGVNATFRVIEDAAGPRRQALGGNARVILQVATQGRYKNTPALLHAFAEVRSRVSDVVLVRIGAPLYPDEVELASRLGLGDHIRCLGHIDDDGVLAEWYNAADVLVFPSLWEGFGWPPLEAMACGTPVVASNIPPVAEVADGAAMLVSPEDPSAIAQAIEQILTDAAVATSLRRHGLERASRFTWAAAARGTCELYEHVRAMNRIREPQP